jgi:NAD(P)-dependent dehydrogenase (short-subunit alcohol dehydrogenase family)
MNLDKDDRTRFGSYSSLRDQIIIITGGASGIGASFVTQFAAQGSRVIFLDVQAEAAGMLVDGLRRSSRHVPLFMNCDLADVQALGEAMGEILANFGAPKALVNNAGNDTRHAIEEVTPEFWDRCIALNLRHQFFTMQAVIPGMKAQRGGSIVNLSSISPIIPSTGVPVYVAAKSGILGLTRALSKELGPWNIRVNAILPGAIETERQRRLWFTPEYEAEILANQSLKRMLQPEDVARMALFLAADDSSAITGQQHVVDGGWV